MQKNKHCGRNEKIVSWQRLMSIFEIKNKHNNDYFLYNIRFDGTKKGGPRLNNGLIKLQTKNLKKLESTIEACEEEKSSTNKGTP